MRMCTHWERARNTSSSISGELRTGNLPLFTTPACARATLSAISYARLCDVAGYEVPRGADVMALIAGKAVGHLDLKDTGGEERVVDMALDLLGPGPLRGHHAGRRVGGRGQGPVPPGYSLGRDLAEVPRTRWAATRYGELWTVDDDAGIRRWLTDPRVTVLITNRPADAMAGRASLAAPA
jgi:glycerophosphoryl diester phosphodiesterase